ncbi:MAG: RCC1 domain-containing protein [Sporichthyaceae bacterium]
MLRAPAAALGLVLALGVLLGQGAPAVRTGGSASAPESPIGPRLATGQEHTCVITNLAEAGGELRCWGFGGGGQLGTGAVSSIGDDELAEGLPPVELGPGLRARAVVAGDYHSCAIVSDASVRCWGENRFGQLGYADTENIGDDETPAEAGPVDLGLGRTAVALAAGSNSTCALLDDASVRCWGFGGSGQLGYGNTETIGDDEVPGGVGPVPLPRPVVAISAGGFHVCAALDDGSLMCWGSNTTGELGLGDTVRIGDDEPVTARRPVFLGFDRRVQGLAAGFSHTCVVLDTAATRCWGYGADGQLGLGFDATIGDDESVTSVDVVKVGAGRTVRQISAALAHTCALLDDGAVRCWGAGSQGRLGLGRPGSVGDAATPDQVAPIDFGDEVRVVEISVGAYHACVLREDDSVRCWGSNQGGQLGVGDPGVVGDDETPAAFAPVRP